MGLKPSHTWEPTQLFPNNIRWHHIQMVPVGPLVREHRRGLGDTRILT